MLKIVNIAPIRGNGLLGGSPAQGALNGRIFACAVWTDCEKIITLLLDADGEANSVNSPLLADHFLQIVQFSRRLEVKLLRIAMTA